MESFKKFNYKLNARLRELKATLSCLKKHGCLERKY